MSSTSTTTSYISPPPTVEYFYDPSPVQLAATNNHAMGMMPDYYPTATETYLHSVPRTTSSFLVLGRSRKPLSSGGKKRSPCSLHGIGVVEKEKQRRISLSDKFTALKLLIIPRRTKEDRATIIASAIEYIQELQRTVEELSSLLVEKKKENQGGVSENSEGEVVVPSPTPQQIQEYIQQKSKDTLVDVRIMEDEVNIKLTQTLGGSCLAAASRALDHLNLDVVHLSGGKIDDCHLYMFNTKIYQGSPILFASAVASKLIQVVDEY